MMRELRDALHEAYEAHARALDAAGVDGLDDALGAIGRRRRVRATGASAVSLAAAAAIVATGITLSSAGGTEPAGVSATASGADGRPAWCDLSTFPAPNPAAFGPADYDGRAYIDPATGTAVAVLPDGTVVDAADPEAPSFARDLDGMLVDGPAYAMVMDFFGGGGGGSSVHDPGYPFLAYEWTTVAPEDAPDGVSPRALMRVHTMTLGFGGEGLRPSVAGPDAVVETVLRYEDGSEETAVIRRDFPGAEIRDYDGLVSASIRATLPTGEEYEIVSYYDPSMTYEAACGPLPEPAPLEETTWEDIYAQWSYDDHGEPGEWPSGPTLDGPESDVFRCGAPVPEGIGNLGITVTRREGEFYDEADGGIGFDFGAEGLSFTASDDLRQGVTMPPHYPGWGGNWNLEGAQSEGVHRFASLAWLSDDGVIVATEAASDPDTSDERLAAMGDGAWSQVVSSTGQVTYFVAVDRSEMSLCDGFTEADAADAELVVLFGQGVAPDDMEWAVLRPDDGA